MPKLILTAAVSAFSIAAFVVVLGIIIIDVGLQ